MKRASTNDLIGDHVPVTIDWSGDQIRVKASKDLVGRQGGDIGVVIPRDSLSLFDETTGLQTR